MSTSEQRTLKVTQSLLGLAFCLSAACSERHEQLIGLSATGAGSDAAAAAIDRELYYVACGSGPQATPTSPQGTQALGHIPTGLPAHLSIGLQENQGGKWLRDSGVAWDYRWAYFAPSGENVDWYNDWGYGGADGSFATQYFEECSGQGFIPAVLYYNLTDDYAPTGDTGKTLAKLQSAIIMSDYFTKFKALMQLAKAHANPVVVILEGNVFGLIQQQSHSNSAASAAIASSGLADLASLPDTVAGFGLAFLQMRKAAGADNVVLGINVPYWSTGDFVSANTADDIQPHVDAQYAYLAPFGLGSNVTGTTYDFVGTNPLAADFDWFRLDQADNGNQSQDLWWDPSDTAALTTRSFNRYAEWLRLFNQASSLRWMLWQIPMGNSLSPNSDNPNTNGGSPPSTAAGWKDNRTEYFFCSESNQHLGKFADTGVIALLFGAGGTGCTDQTSDYYPDGQLFLKTHAGAIIAAGGFPLTP